MTHHIIVFLAGLALGVLLFLPCLRCGIREGRLRARLEAQKKKTGQLTGGAEEIAWAKEYSVTEELVDKVQEIVLRYGQEPLTWWAACKMTAKLRDLFPGSGPNKTQKAP